MARSTTIPCAPSWLQSPASETLWRWIAFAFVAYWLLFVSSALHGHREANVIGGGLIVAVLFWAALERLWVRVDGVVVAAVAAMLIPVVQALTGDPTQTSSAVFKHESICAVMAISRLLRLPPASRSKVRWLLGLPVLIVLAISVAIGRPDALDATRRDGLFANPNNLALIPFLLLFLIDEVRDPLVVQFAVHAIVIAVLIFSGTSGAVIAYAIGLAVHLRRQFSPALRFLVLTGGLAAGSAIAAFAVLDGADVLPQTRLVKQILLMRDQFQNILQGGEIPYYQKERLLGPGVTSGVWRLAHWRHTLITYAHGMPAQQIFGFGIGSSPLLLPNFPHNEYLRVLFEQGAVGLILFLTIWALIIKTAPPALRYVALIIAIYSFSENNLDNFPFMALLILFLAASDRAITPGSRNHNESPHRKQLFLSARRLRTRNV